MIIIEVKIPKEIRAHRETIFFGLSARQFICAILAVGLAAGIYLGLGNVIGKEAASWLCLLLAAPVAIAGFFHYNGMTLEQFLWAFIKSELLCAGPRRFDSVNLHEEMFADIMEGTQTVFIPDSNPDADIDDSRTETALTITITAKTAEQMRLQYNFSKYQNDALDILLENLGSLNIPMGSLTISQEDAIALLENLPDDLDPARKAVVETAVQLVGRVSYFWGGKSLTLGWDDRWGVSTEVTAAGSGSTGTVRPFGLDCSGFVDWTFYNATNGSYYPGRGGGAATQRSYCTNISWNDAQPGDLVFYPDDSHVGIVGGKDADGNLLIVHCSGGANGVVITGSAGFTVVARPDCFTN